MNKYLKYALEAIKMWDIYIIWTSFKYFATNTPPKKSLQINNPTMGNFMCRANTTDFMYSFFSYEYKIKLKILDKIKDFEVFIDVGACIGDYSIWMAKNNLKSYAFEPNKDNFKSLNENINLNNLSNNVTTFNYGLGLKNEKATFGTHPINRGYSGKDINYDEFINQEVEIKKFDSVFESMNIGYDTPIIMKIDVEGMEADVIEGAENFFSKASRILLIFESHTRSSKTLTALSKIAMFTFVDMDELNIGILIDNTAKTTKIKRKKLEHEIS
ncbi:MAG: FkbM family methyltransferase [Ichthyobacteriaceae bacterium]|nr:FkbM family methyltransferase [Ichthyobacteriaceae bacterium]